MAVGGDGRRWRGRDDGRGVMGGGGEERSRVASFEPTTPDLARRGPRPKDGNTPVFECAAKSCKGCGNGCYVHRYLDTSDMKSMSNLHKHVKICWTSDIVAQADKTKDVKAARAALADLKDVDISIMAVFD